MASKSLFSFYCCFDEDPNFSFNVDSNVFIVCILLIQVLELKSYPEHFQL